MRTNAKVDLLISVLLTTACQTNRASDGGSTDSGPVTISDAGIADAGPTADAGPSSDAGPYLFDAGALGPFCSLPGSLVHDATGTHLVAGGLAAPDLSWLSIPQGFCVHHFATVPNARQLRFAPGGELFVASPSTHTTSNGQGGLSAIVVVPDDNHDGVGDPLVKYADGLPSTQGLLFANGAFYFQDGTLIRSEPYVTGQRQTSGDAGVFADITVYSDPLHWPKTLDISDEGEIYVGNGSTQSEKCVQPTPFQGGILLLDGTDGGRQIAKGFRNPIDVKCHRDGNDHCFSTELNLDQSAPEGGREKLVLIHEGDDWGFPCCATNGVPFRGLSVACPGDSDAGCPPDCSGVVEDTNSFLIGNTPFGFDFDDAQFPPPWDHQVLLALHGHSVSWSGARIVAIAFDPTTGYLLPSSTTDGGADSGNLRDFATGWDDGTLSHGRPADIEFSPDGRMFVADDQRGEIFWIAPLAAK